MVLWKLVDWPITIPWFSTDISLLEWRYGHLPIYTYIYTYMYTYIYIITIYIYTLTFDYGTVKSSKLTEPIILTRNHGKLVLNARVFQASSETRCSNHWKTKQQEDIGRPCPIGGRSTVSIYHHLSPFITIYPCQHWRTGSFLRTALPSLPETFNNGHFGHVFWVPSMDLGGIISFHMESIGCHVFQLSFATYKVVPPPVIDWL